MTSSRRLVAIVLIDVAGYSRLMGADEEGTLARLMSHYNELLHPAIARFAGRIVKTTGDGLLAEFDSVVDAVRCLVEIQEAMRVRNKDVAPDRRIAFRGGVNLGDVILKDGDIFGTGVNVAARLETLAEPGGICISAAVHEEVAGKIAVAFRDMGEHRLKNIAHPVRVYQARFDGTPGPGEAGPRGKMRAHALVVAGIAPIAAIAGAGIAAWYLIGSRTSQPTPTASSAPTAPAPAAPAGGPGSPRMREMMKGN